MPRIIQASAEDDREHAGGLKQTTSDPKDYDSQQEEQRMDPLFLDELSPLGPVEDPQEQEETLPPEAPPSMKMRVRVLIGMIVLLVLVAVNLVIGAGKMQFDKVVSGSMEPTLQIGDVLLSDGNAMPQRYDVVCLHDPSEPEDKLVKRIIGMPGDRIVIQSGIIYINGKEEYSTKIEHNAISWHDLHVRVPENSVFLLGDNRNNSFDSLNFGAVPYDQITGVVSRVIWPPRRFGRPTSLHENQS